MPGFLKEFFVIINSFNLSTEFLNLGAFLENYLNFKST